MNQEGDNGEGEPRKGIVGHGEPKKWDGWARCGKTEDIGAK